MKVTVLCGKISRESKEAIGWDMHANEAVLLEPGEVRLVTTGLRFKLEGAWGMIRDRSSMGKRGITSRAGIIDPDYEGVVGVILVNETKAPYQILYGDRIAQILFLPVERPVVTAQGGTVEIKDKIRGEGGFGSTGK